MTKNIVQEVDISIWSLDLIHSAVHFKVRHMGMAWVRGDFRIAKGTLQWNGEAIADSGIKVDVASVSVNTGNDERDAHLRNVDFLDAEDFPLIHFRSTTISQRSNDTAVVEGLLTIKDVTRRVELSVTEISPPTRDYAGKSRCAATASTVINRKDFGLTWNMVLEFGGLMVGEDVHIDLDVQFTKDE